MDQLTENKLKIINLIKSTHHLDLPNKSNISKILKYLEEFGYYTCPCSIKYHLNCEGGLAQHSLNVYQALSKLCKEYDNSIISPTSIIITALLHDICKTKLYVKTNGSWNYAPNYSKLGHSKLSLEILDSIGFGLNDQEKNMIKYHMGMYGSIEFIKNGEYTLKDLSNAINEDPSVFLLHNADMLASHYMEG